MNWSILVVCVDSC